MFWRYSELQMLGELKYTEYSKNWSKEHSKNWRKSRQVRSTTWVMKMVESYTWTAPTEILFSIAPTAIWKQDDCRAVRFSSTERALLWGLWVKQHWFRRSCLHSSSAKITGCSSHLVIDLWWFKTLICFHAFWFEVACALGHNCFKISEQYFSLDSSGNKA